MADQTVDLWATDEVHFQQHGSGMVTARQIDQLV